MVQNKPLYFFVAATLCVNCFFQLNPWNISKRTSTRYDRPAFLPSFFQDWRDRFLSQHAPTDELGLCRGFFLGATHWIPEHTRTLYQRSGLSHLLAASGFNCWIVSIALGVLATLFFALFQSLLPCILGFQIKNWLLPTTQLVGAWLFWSWSDFSPPITRSAFLISIKFFLFCFGIRAPFHRILLVQYGVSLLVLPSLWSNPSFQLTYGCLFGMFWFQHFMGQAEAFRFKHLISKSVFSYFVSTFGACLGTAPVTWFFFEEVRWTSLWTNWLLSPAVSLFIMPLSLIQMLLLVPLGCIENASWLNALLYSLSVVLNWICRECTLVLSKWMSFLDMLNELAH